MEWLPQNGLQCLKELILIKSLKPNEYSRLHHWRGAFCVCKTTLKCMLNKKT